MFRQSDSPMSAQFNVTDLLGMSGNKEVDDELQIFRSRSVYAQAIRELDIQTDYRKRKGLRWIGEYPKRSLLVNYPEQFLDTMRRGVEIKISSNGKSYKVKIKYGDEGKSTHRVQSLSEPFETCIGTLSFQTLQEVKKGDNFLIKTKPMAYVVEDYKKQIAVSRASKESNVVAISTTTDMTERDVLLVRKIIDLYNLDAYTDKNLLASNTANFIDERLRLVADELALSEDDVQAYKTENSLTNMEEEAKLLLQTSGEIQTQMLSLETQKNIISYISEYIEDENNRYALIPANLGVDDPSVITLIEQYNQAALQRMKLIRSASVNNPVVSQLEQDLQVLRTNIITTIASVRQGLDIALRDLQRQQDKFDNRRGESPKLEREYREIARQHAITEKLYVMLYTKREETALTLASMVMPLRVIDEPQAEPIKSAPYLKYILPVCGFLGLVLCFCFFWLYDFFNTRITDKQDYKRLISAPYVGSILQDKSGKNVVLADGVNTPQAELFRLLRTNIGFMLPPAEEGKGRVVLVTSSVNGEGKSFVAINTAVSFALLGKRVAIVGLDIRKPMLASYLNLPQGRLTSVLADNDASISDAIIPSGVHPNLDVLPAGVVPPNPSELLQSANLDKAIDELRSRYDYIFLDTAPVGLVSDTYLLDRLSDMTLYVSRLNYTTRENIETLNQVKSENRLKNMACALNGVKKVSAGYGYGTQQ